MIGLPEEYGLTNQVRTATVNRLDNGCSYSTVSVKNSPNAYEATGLFGLWTYMSDNQLLDVNLHFGTIATGDNIGVLDAYVLWYRSVYDTNTSDSNTLPDAYFSTYDGRWNHVNNVTTLEFRINLAKGLRPHDIITILVDDDFDVSGVSNCRSVFLGKGIFDQWDDTWEVNKLKGTAPQSNANPGYMEYPLRYQKDENMFLFYDLMSNLRAEELNTSDTHVAIRCDGFKNPSTFKSASDLSFVIIT
jgi:hypothetical protein